MRLSLAEVVWNRFRARIKRFYNNLPHKAWILIARNQLFYRDETLYNTVVSVRWDNIITLWLNDRQQASFSKQ